MPKTNCPTCGKEYIFERASSLRYFPFCSERCKMTDLHHWLSEHYRITEDVINPPDAPEE